MSKIELTVSGEPTMQRCPAIEGRSIKIFNWVFVWWGLFEIHKWRWHRDHIDLGCLSVYGFRYNHWFWRFIAMVIKPLRIWYNSGRKC